jgi:lysyl-tRNA synthetase class 2
MYDFDDERIAKVDALEAEGFRCWPAGWGDTASAESIRQAAEGVADTELPARGRFRFAGRLLFKNDMGKAGFGRMLDASGRLQVYVKKDTVGEATFSLWKRLDLGDIVGVEGTLMRTRTGELSIQVDSLTLLTKCIRSLPDKFHGFNDPEARQRQRYVDLFVNDETRDTFRKRSRIVRHLRDFFDGRGFMEVETPMMRPRVRS